MNISQLSMWVVFNSFVLVMLALDLGVFHRKERRIKLKEALLWSAVWISLALVFVVFVRFSMGVQSASEFLTAYLTEKMLSVDNLFVFILIFSYFGVGQQYQHKILFWGVLTAIVMRGIFIFAGEMLIQNLHWSIFLFGGFLVVAGVKIAFENGEKQVHPERNLVVRFFKKFMPITNDAEGRFFVRRGAHYYATMFFIVLIVIETTDLVFALDSVPAVVSLTYDPFIAYTSNIFAILGLRALYFALTGIKDIFQDLRLGIAVILVFVGVRMVLSDFYKVPISSVLYIIVSILMISALISIVRQRNSNKTLNRI